MEITQNSSDIESCADLVRKYDIDFDDILWQSKSKSSRVLFGKELEGKQMDVIIKIVQDLSEAEKNQVLREADFLLRHKGNSHVVELVDLIVKEGMIIQILKSHPNCTLEELVKEKNKTLIPERTQHRYFLSLIQAIHLLHQDFILHQDIKIQNILLYELDIRLVDFGFSRHLKSSNSYQSTTMAPELIIGQSFKMCSEIFNLGLVFYQTAMGKLPFKLNKSQYDEKAYTSIDYSTIPDDLADLLKQMLQLLPINRINWLNLIQHPYFQQQFHKSDHLIIIKEDMIAFYSNPQNLIRLERQEGIKNGHQKYIFSLKTPSLNQQNTQQNEGHQSEQKLSKNGNDQIITQYPLQDKFKQVWEEKNLQQEKIPNRNNFSQNQQQQLVVQEQMYQIHLFQGLQNQLQLYIQACEQIIMLEYFGQNNNLRISIISGASLVALVLSAKLTLKEIFRANKTRETDTSSHSSENYQLNNLNDQAQTSYIQQKLQIHPVFRNFIDKNNEKIDKVDRPNFPDKQYIGFLKVILVDLLLNLLDPDQVDLKTTQNNQPISQFILIEFYNLYLQSIILITQVIHSCKQIDMLTCSHTFLLPSLAESRTNLPQINESMYDFLLNQKRLIYNFIQDIPEDIIIPLNVNNQFKKNIEDLNRVVYLYEYQNIVFQTEQRQFQQLQIQPFQQSLISQLIQKMNHQHSALHLAFTKVKTGQGNILLNLPIKYEMAQRLFKLKQQVISTALN